MSITILASTLALATFGSSVSARTDYQYPYANQVIQWIDCGTKDQPTLQCATLNVPLDYTDLSSPALNLPVVRIPATDRSPRGSIITNPGGPGASGIEDLVQSGDQTQRLVISLHLLHEN